jgi:hypothetical protein
MTSQYDTPPPLLGGCVVGVVCAGAWFVPPAGLSFVDEDPHPVKPAATANATAVPKMSFRAPARLARMTVLSGETPSPGLGIDTEQTEE